MVADQIALVRVAALLRREGFIYAAADCETLLAQLHQRDVEALAELILAAQRACLESAA